MNGDTQEQIVSFNQHLFGNDMFLSGFKNAVTWSTLCLFTVICVEHDQSSFVKFNQSLGCIYKQRTDGVCNRAVAISDIGPFKLLMVSHCADLESSMWLNSGAVILHHMLHRVTSMV